MALARILSLTRRPAYQPSPRFGHYAVPIGGKVGGRTDNFVKTRSEPIESVEVLDTLVEQWQHKSTSGEEPSPMYNGACAAVGNTIYTCCGYDGTSPHNSVHVLDSNQWRTVRPTNPDQGPMPKSRCGMIAISNDKLALVRGCGIPTHPIQPGSTFVTDSSFTNGRGFTNKLHFFCTKKSEWSSPIMTGGRPPPGSGFTFTAIDSDRRVLFAGYQTDVKRKVNDAFIMNHRLMHWTKLQRAGGPWPKARSGHAACCINYDSDSPLLLVFGGLDNDGNILKDTWLLNAGSWKEVELPDELQPRCWHTLTAISLAPGLTEVTMFGGYPKFDVSDGELPKLADTVLLRLESVPSSGAGPSPREWVLTGFTAMDQLGQPESLREKLRKMEPSPGLGGRRGRP